MYTNAIVVVTQFESVGAVALERADGIQASAVVAHVRMAAALVNVHASVTGRRESVSVVADALETSIQICAFTVPANSISLVALINVLNTHKTQVNVRVVTIAQA